MSDEENENVGSVGLEVTQAEVYKNRRRSGIWDLFTADEVPWQKKSAECRHCHERYNHHKKSEQAKMHLNGCHVFRKLMNGLDVEERPTWYVGGKRRLSPQKGIQTSIVNYTVPGLTLDEDIKFRRTMAMYFCGR